MMRCRASGASLGSSRRKLPRREGVSPVHSSGNYALLSKGLQKQTCQAAAPPITLDAKPS